MREHIARLELRIKELESAEQTSPPVTLFDPHAQPSPYFSESSSSSSHDSPGGFTVSASASPVPFPIGTRIAVLQGSHLYCLTSRWRDTVLGRSMGQHGCMSILTVTVMSADV